MKYFLEHNGKKYSDKDLIDAFYQLGIKRGDILCVHTELFKFGVPLLSRNEFLQTILNCFFEVIGKEGTLIMPTFTYSFCKNEVYDKINSKTKMGALNEYFRKQTEVKRTNDPIFSFAIKGVKEELFLKDTTSCFGENCVYDMLSKINGKIILLGSKTNGYTFTHFIEEKARVPYRYFKEFQGKIIFENGMSKNIKINYYVRKLNINSDLDVYKQIKILQEDDNFKVENFANSCIVSINANKYLQATLETLKKDAYCLL
ncbi:TPA: aminoglycoside N(3)-acetyltransferase [Campylobacter jejuni]|nr:aminoglycoside N(3)-acetyltransferase [Campylobacter jejuni]EAK7187228.1 aminoglycoside N(3)-acetyltransferase [Campylobacter jejuni]EDO7429877.1 acetyltransferase [Campylobacter jejuni]EFP6607310.1 aminoglycoside N(3)-acetyltransferase [Campylobacter jejuni]EGI1620119.1 aminoglycoside N(3)-acetyltransferase [Campylobacter jejuni]